MIDLPAAISLSIDAGHTSVPVPIKQLEQLMAGQKIRIDGKVIDPKTGKLKDKPPRGVSAKIRQRKSKKQKVVRRTV